MPKKEPRKLAQRLGSILFGPSGTTKILETLPASQQDRELAIVRKFIGAMAHFERRVLCPPMPGEEPADCLTQEGTQRVGIQVTDVVKSEHAHRRGTQDKFVGRVRELLSSRYSEFNGLSVTLYHRAPEPLPPVDSKEGARLAQLVADKLCACIFELRSWGLRQRAVYRWSEGPDHQYVVALIQRHATTDLGKSATLEFSGNFSHLNAHLVLTQAIEKKLAKSYSSFSNGQFWLLVYGDEPFLVEDEAVDHARSFLQSRKHPFDEIWGFFPYAAQELGFPRKVWP